MKKIITVLTSLLLMMACTQSPPPTDPSVITARSQAWEQALNSGDLDGLVALYQGDARLMPPNQPMQSGSDAVRAAFGAMIEAGLSATLTSVETTV